MSQALERLSLPAKQLLSTFCFIGIIQMIGLLMRLQFIAPIPGFNYTFFLHAHSHVALLGWVHALLALLLPRIFVKDHPNNYRPYNRLFWVSQFSVLGMLISFPLQGYALVSISFSTFFLFCSYRLAYLLWKDTAHCSSPAYKLLRASLFFLVFSSIGPWLMGPIMALKLGKTPYHLAIYFYLHFQYNAWFTLACTALGLRYFENKSAVAPHMPKAVSLIIWSTLPTVLLSALWLEPPLWVYGVSLGGALMQAYGFFLAWRAIPELRLSALSRGSLKHWSTRLFYLSAVCLMAKILLQLFTAFPYFAQLAAQQRPLVIFYLHLVLLGGISGFLIAYLKQYCFPRISSSWLSLGFWLYLLGFLSSEGLLLYQGLCQGLNQPVFAAFYVSLFGCSLIIPIGFFAIGSGLLTPSLKRIPS